MKPLLFISALLLLAFTAAVSLSQDAAPAPSQTPANNPVKSTADSRARAKKLYDVDCAMCHNANGNGKSDLAKDMSLTLLDWSDEKSLADKTDGQLFDAIRIGKDKMPPETEGRAKNDDVWNLVHYIRSFSKAAATSK
jgi:mono/diheme cytochrome c family protein